MILKELKHLVGIDFNKVSTNEFSELICSLLKKGKIKKEVFVSDRGDGRSGRISLVYELDEEIIAIELDRLYPRKKSIFKLKKLAANHRFIVTRSPFTIIEI